MKKRLLSMLLVIVMVISMMPTGVMADVSADVSTEAIQEMTSEAASDTLSLEDTPADVAETAGSGESTTAEETTVAETTAAETTAAETTSAETTASETTSAETTASETTSAETTASETTSAETSVEETTAATSETKTGILQFRNDLSTEPQKYTQGPGYAFLSVVAVDSYGENKTALPESTTVNYQWYSSNDNQVDASDVKIEGNPYPYYNISKNVAGTTYYYVVATANIDGVEYSATSSVGCIMISAANINVTLTVNNKGVLAADKDGNAVNNTSVSVVDLNYDGRHSYDEALQAAHTKLMAAGDYATTTTEYGLSVTKLWGVETTNNLFYIDGKALTTNIGETTVSVGNKLYISINKDDKYYSDKYTTFNAAAMAVTTGRIAELTLTDIDGKALAGISIGIWEAGTFKAIEGKATDGNGKVSLTFNEAGTYVVTATGTIRATVTDYSKWPETSEVEFDCPIMAPGCTITVKAPGELKFDGQFTDNTLNYKVGETNTFASLIKARYYIDGTQDWSVTATTTWYRVGTGSGGAAEKVENFSASTKFTSEDVGSWKYYMYAECEAYGIKYSAMSNFLNVVISEPTPIVGNTQNGFFTNVSYETGFGNTIDIGYSADKTDYEITHYDVGSGDSIMITLPRTGLWYGYRINGAKTGSAADAEWSVRNSSVYVNIPTTFAAGSTNVVTVIAGTKYDSDGNGKITTTDEFDKYDAYNFTVTTVPAISSMTVLDAKGSRVELDGSNYWSTYYATDINGTTDSETIKLSANFKAENGVELYLGDNETPYTANLNNLELSLADYKDESGVANIPLKTFYTDEEGKTYEHSYTLHLSPSAPVADFAPPVIKTQPAAESSIAKDTSVTLKIEIEQPEKGTISYQWMSMNTKAAKNGTAIEGATSATFEAAAGNFGGSKYYRCLVSLTIDGVTATTLSDVAVVTTELTYVLAPAFTIQPGLANDRNGKGVYNTEYIAGNKFDTMYLGVACSGFPDSHSMHKEPGCNAITVQCYYNTTPSTEGGIPIDGTYANIMSGGTFGRYLSFVPASGLPEGTNYVYFVATSTATDDPEKFATGVSDFVKLTYAPAEINLEGEGTEEAPYLLKTGEDFVTIQKLVNEAGNTLSGVYFNMTNDITLPEDWKAMGSEARDGIFFGGILDGCGYKLSFSKGSQPLCNYTLNAEFKNLKIYGEEIQGSIFVNSGYWTNQIPGAWFAKINNVTLLSGTSTLESGFVSGSVSTFNPVYISNCSAEEGVIIGYDKSKNDVGTFGGRFIGTIENCHSSATVYGVDNVGGFIGRGGNAMARLSLTNCCFIGDVEASGKNVGGLIGSNYEDKTAPNALCVCIQNCYVNAKVSGKQNVGGLLGSDAGVQQAWENGIGYIRSNVFYGTLSGSKNVGGVAGYFAALNKHNVIEDNYFYDTNGCTNAIGGVEHIDTSVREFGMNDDGIFYYDTSTDDLDDIKDFVDAEDKGTGEWIYTSVSKTNHNRTDDPMGKDKEKLGKAYTAEQMKDGTVLKLLNESETSLKNWVQGEKHPIVNDETYIKGLTISGNYKTEYYIGEELDMTGAVFTATWSNGSVTSIDPEDVTITGFDSYERASLILTAAYSGASVQFEVKVVKKPVSTEDINSIKVSFTMLGDEIHFDEDGKNLTDEIHTLTEGNLTAWIAETTYTVDLNATVWDVIQKVLKENGMECEYTHSLNTVYIESVTKGELTLGEFSNGANSGWMYTLNGVHSDLGVAQQYLEDGDVIIFHYSDDYTLEKDESSEPGQDTEGNKPITDANADKVFNETGIYLEDLAADTTPTVSSIGGEWMVIGLERSGREVPEEYYANVVKYVEENINDKEQLHRAKSTDNSRVILALTALGYDVKDVAGHNLLEGLADMSYVTKQGINGPIWALIAFDSHDYEIPEGDVTRDALIEKILDAQLANGGWALSGTAADPDMTGMALQALAPYCGSNAKVKAAVDRALACLSEIQDANGGFSALQTDGSRVPTCESTAQVIVALTALGIDPETDERFIKNGCSAIDALCGYAVEGGGFAHVAGGAIDGMANEQGYYALTAYARFLNEKTSLYDMSDVNISGEGEEPGDEPGDKPGNEPGDEPGDEPGNEPGDEPEKKTYQILSGDKSTWKKNSDGSITIRSDGLYEDFQGLLMDGKEIDPKNYTAKSGSTIVTLKGEYLDTLKKGEHKVTFLFEDGEAVATLTIVGASAGNQMGDDTNLPLYITMLMIGMAGTAGVIVTRKRKFSR